MFVKIKRPPSSSSIICIFIIFFSFFLCSMMCLFIVDEVSDCCEIYDVSDT